VWEAVLREGAAVDVLIAHYELVIELRHATWNGDDRSRYQKRLDCEYIAECEQAIQRRMATPIRLP